MKIIITIIVILCSVNAFSEKLKFSDIFASNMVIQRNQDNNIWGYATKGSKVTCEFREKSTTTTADKVTGKWTLKLASGKAGGPFTMTVKSNKESLTLKNILVGDVWICSGQSNMAARIGRAKIDDSYKNKIRIFIIDDKAQVFSEEESETNDKVLVKQTWTEAKSTSVGGFSNVGFNFGLKLADELNIPIGLISCDVGGSKVEAWTSRAALRKDKESKAALEEFLANAAKNKRPRWISRYHSCLYSTMLRPIIGYGIKGVTWYQGESNCYNGDRYKDFFGNMITDWRAQWGQGDFPFYYVQIAPFGYRPFDIQGSNLVREAQRQGITEYKNAGMACTIDLGSWKNIHPGGKHIVGQRLALWALAKTYEKAVEFTGPLYKSAKFSARSVTISFDYAKGLNVKAAIKGIYMAGSDKVFHPAIAKIVGEKIVVTCDKVSSPKSVRYGWGVTAADFPGGLYNSADLPAPAFRTDEWHVEVTHKQK
jgi:sialate O-acetylesterase